MAASAASLLGTGGKDWAAQAPLLTGVLPGALPEGDYRFASRFPIPSLPRSASSPEAIASAATRRANERKAKRLVLPEGASRDQVLALAEALYFGRDLINTPANDLGPAELESRRARACHRLRRQHQGDRGIGPALRQFPHDPRRGPRQRPRAAADRSPLGLASTRRR